MTPPDSSPDDSAAAQAARELPAADASIDQMIRWVEQTRRHNPDADLKDLIASDSISTESLVELAAVDLIGQRRRGLDVLPEHYLKQFPQLAAAEGWVLDLIDAELCVRREMKDDRDAAFYVDRFPGLAAAIEQLVHLAPATADVALSADLLIAPTPVAPAAKQQVPGKQSPTQVTVDIATDWESQSEPLLFERDMTVAGLHRNVSRQQRDVRTDDTIDSIIPVNPPDWMGGARCVATSPLETGRYWLVKGRDTAHGETVAMKIIPLPASLGRTERTRILDLCEASSSVSHPAWVAPRIAAINNGHLAVIRPWIFGNTFANPRAVSSPTKRLATLVTVAYALAAAHRIGSTHGSVKAQNIVTDHESAVNLIDAVSGVAGWEHYLSIWDNELANTLAERIRRDTCDLLGLISKECINATDSKRLHWIDPLTSSIDFQTADACALIGERLQSWLDQPPPKRSWWRK